MDRYEVIEIYETGDAGGLIQSPKIEIVFDEVSGILNIFPEGLEDE